MNNTHAMLDRGGAEQNYSSVEHLRRGKTHCLFISSTNVKLYSCIEQDADIARKTTKVLIKIEIIIKKPFSSRSTCCATGSNHARAPTPKPTLNERDIGQGTLYHRTIFSYKFHNRSYRKFLLPTQRLVCRSVQTCARSPLCVQCQCTVHNYSRGKHTDHFRSSSSVSSPLAICVIVR